MLELRNNSFVINFDSERMMINLDQLRVYTFRESGSYGSQLSSGFSQIPLPNESYSSELNMPIDNSQPHDMLRAKKLRMSLRQSHVEVGTRMLIM